MPASMPLRRGSSTRRDGACPMSWWTAPRSGSTGAAAPSGAYHPSPTAATSLPARPGISAVLLPVVTGPLPGLAVIPGPYDSSGRSTRFGRPGCLSGRGRAPDSKQVEAFARSGSRLAVGGPAQAQNSSTPIAGPAGCVRGPRGQAAQAPADAPESRVVGAQVVAAGHHRPGGELPLTWQEGRDVSPVGQARPFVACCHPGKRHRTGPEPFLGRPRPTCPGPRDHRDELQDATETHGLGGVDRGGQAWTTPIATSVAGRTRWTGISDLPGDARQALIERLVRWSSGIRIRDAMSGEPLDVRAFGSDLLRAPGTSRANAGHAAG